LRPLWNSAVESDLRCEIPPLVALGVGMTRLTTHGSRLTAHDSLNY